MKPLQPTPHKYEKIYEDVLSRIESGELVPGTRLPGVRALGEQYGCTYHTVRHAFESLVEQGYIEQIHGKGTYVRERAEDLVKRAVSSSKVLRTTDRIGVLIPLRHWGYYVTSLIDHLHECAAEQNIKLNIRTVTEIDIGSVALAHELMKQDCCAIIIPWIGEGWNLSDLQDFVRASELPVVVPNVIHGLENNCYRDSRLDQDTLHTGTYFQCRYFQELGYSNIALLGPSAETVEFFERKLMYYSRWICQENRPSLIGLVDESPEDYDRIIERWKPMRGDLAVIVYHDEMAIDFMDACQRNEISIPTDFGILGHNNNPLGLRANPPLTTMYSPYTFLANGMLDHALALSAGSSGQVAGREPVAINVRESCGGRARFGNDIDDVVVRLIEDFNNE